MMNRFVRLVPCVALLASALLAGAPAPGRAQSGPQLSKELRDGEWQAGNPAAVELPAPEPAVAAQEDSLLGSWGRLVYTSLGSGNNEIYLRKYENNSYFSINLTNYVSSDTSPRFNPAVDRIAFVTNRDQNNEIYLMNLAGGGLRRLTRTAAADIQPFWSPDGSRIVFASLRDGNYNIYVMNADGTGQVRLTSDAASDVMPAWSPDGQTIAWVRTGADSGAIWLMSADGSNQRPITGQLRYLQHPSWSPEGTQLAFDYDADGDGFNTPATIARDGGAITQVPVSSYGGGTPGYKDDYGVGVWAPPGDWLAVSVASYRLDTLRLTGLYVGMAFLNGVNNRPLGFPQYDYQPDVRSIDHERPTSSLASLPLYTRGTTVPLSWSGQDVGVAGGVRYDIEVRSGAGPWTRWRSGVTETSAEYTGTLGTRVAFRLRARDAAGNTEAWHSETGDVATTFFATTASGTITDNRGTAVPGADLQLAPAPISGGVTSAAGSYAAYLTSSPTLAARPSHAGYTSPPATTLDGTFDQRWNPYLLPEDNSVANSGFEASASQLPGWTAGGTLPSVVVQGGVTGDRAARLGASCAAPCLTDPETTTLLPSDYGLAIAAQSDGTLHALNFRPEPGAYTLQHTTRTPAGTWSQPQPLGANGVSDKLVVDALGTLHATWFAGERVMYSRRPAGGSWAPAEEVGVGTETQLFVDAQGNLHLVYACVLGACEPQVQYRKRTAAGSWQAPVLLPGKRVGAALDADGRLYLAWSENDAQWLSVLSSNGVLSAARHIGAVDRYSKPAAVAVDRAGTAHVIWGSWLGLSYVSVDAAGVTTGPALLELFGEEYQIAVDQSGVVHVVNQSYREVATNGMYYRTKRPGAAWSTPLRLSSWPYAVTRMLTDAAGRVHLLYQDSGQEYLVYRATPLASSAGDAVLRQSVAVPSWKPTLAFEYQLVGSGGQLDVAVKAGAATQPLLSVSQGVGWQLGSVDLSPWAGQSVEVIFTLHQTSGAPLAAVWLDDVSVGAWKTPVITELTPERISSIAVARTLTIVGENFEGTPAVLLDGRSLGGVERVDGQTLRVMIPAGTPSGRYALSVVNPGGQAATRSLVLGQLIMVPFVWR